MIEGEVYIMRSLFLECKAGISGDMLVAAMLDMGADKKALDKALLSIPAKGFMYEISRVNKGGLDCCDFNVILDGEHDNHDHDMEYLHGDADEHDHEHEEHCHDHVLPSHMPENEHLLDHGNESAYHDGYYSEHDYMHEHEVQLGHEFLQAHKPHILTNHDYQADAEEHEHHHEHRNLKDIVEIINQVQMTENARAIALKIFDILAEAEGEAHGVPKDEVHFHEVGALDSIVDIIAIAVCYDSLNVEGLYTGELCEGSGTVRCQHGILPIPVPATANIVKKYNLPLKIMPVEGEFVTPTGAAVVAALRVGEVSEQYQIVAQGLGAGKRTYAIPSVLRGYIINFDVSVAAVSVEKIYKLETNLDDISGEALGYVMDLLLNAGALDVCYIPIYMKKNRPAYQLQVLCKPELVAAMEEIIYNETSTLGVRRQMIERSYLARHEEEVNTMYGPIRVKVCEAPAGERYAVEFESAAAAAKEHNVPLQEVYREVDANFT